MKEYDLVSIIVPVYNVEKYIEKCILSIINQTYTNLEIIIVNDGSLDHSENIIKEYISKDNRIKYIKRDNGGLGAARNTGIENATGKYIAFVDSDDWIAKCYVERFVEVLLKDKTDIAICEMAYIYVDDSLKARTPKIKKRCTISAEEALKREFIGKEYKFHAPNKFCKKELFDKGKIRFAEGKLYEDVMTTYKLFLEAKTVSLVPEALYYYLQSRSGSIMSTEIKLQRFTDMYLAIDDIISNSRIDKKDYKMELQALYIGNVISLVNYIYPIYGKVDKTILYNYRTKIITDKYYNIYGKQYLINKELSIISKLRMFMIRNFFDIYCWSMSIVKRGK